MANERNTEIIVRDLLRQNGYYLEKSEGGYISLDFLEPHSCTIHGSFALTLIRNPLGGGEVKYPENLLDIYVDTLRIADGKFHIPLVPWAQSINSNSDTPLSARVITHMKP